MPRYASIWFPFLLTDYAARKQPELRGTAFVIASRKKGRMLIEAVSEAAMRLDIHPGMVLADCKAIFPELQVLEYEPGRNEQLLNALAEWCIRYTPFVALDLPDSLILDTSGCVHLWGGELKYIETIRDKMGSYGYTTRIAIADTVGAAWGITHYGKTPMIVPFKQQKGYLKQLPAAALQLDATILARLKKLGLQRIETFIDLPHEALRRRFGPELPLRLSQVLGESIEVIVPIKPIEPYMERLCCLEPIVTRIGITIALEQLLKLLCLRFETEGIGMRKAVFTAYRIDGDKQQIEIGTVYPSRKSEHLFRLFEHKIATLEPALGFELFVLETPQTEPLTQEQAAMWNAVGHNDKKIAELLDRVMAKAGLNAVSRFLPAEHYWPERAIKKASPLWEKKITSWRTDLPRPVCLMPNPEPIEVMAMLPDYPPMQFRYKGKLNQVVKSDGPERIEQEWWLKDGLYRDYYCVEDKEGSRYWLFRSGPYDQKQPQWFIHGFFA